MSGQIMWGKFLAMSALILGGGYALMTATTPTEEELYARLSPDLQRKVDAIRAARENPSKVKEQLQEASDDNKIVWAEDQQTQQQRKK
ncbi:Assembly factor CBP4 [Vanrija pseudolonga]|uniref:Cytochrome b mRNA-processing protein 4 n=1 Tax=Vanrija pseudolonga TaxID=143232 RepID=A0AAF0Y556_9TREE|nr:Assembly factor CBP4 [Vanrija pseudolonga]